MNFNGGKETSERSQSAPGTFWVRHGRCTGSPLA